MLSNVANLFAPPGGFGGSEVFDTLTGLGGADKFVFGTSHVTITDFSEIEGDKIDISHANNGAGFTVAEFDALLAASTGDTVNSATITY